VIVLGGHLWRHLHADEAAAVARVYAFFITVFVYKELKFSKGARCCCRPRA